MLPHKQDHDTFLISARQYLTTNYLYFDERSILTNIATLGWLVSQARSRSLLPMCALTMDKFLVSQGLLELRYLSGRIMHQRDYPNSPGHFESMCQTIMKEVEAEGNKVIIEKAESVDKLAVILRDILHF